MPRDPGARFQETWVTVGEQALCALVNGERGWLMYVPAPGAPSFSSRNPAYDGPGDATIDDVLDNGQRDSYPAAWAYPLGEVMHALDYFRRDGARPPFIMWHAAREFRTSHRSARGPR